MRTIGLDLGTTTVSAVAADTESGVLSAYTVPNGTFYTDVPAWNKTQDAEKILEKACACAARLLEAYPDCAVIGVTGQQHGIVYLDAAGRCVSPLYTWQDGRAGLPEPDGQTWAQQLSACSGYAVPVGYGMATHAYNCAHGLVPADAAVFCTIQDYVAMHLSGRTAPLLDASDAASFGLFDLERGAFDTEAAVRAGLDPALFPAVSHPAVLGRGPLGIPVCTAIGDNQASFIGATGGKAAGSMLLNVGTGSQISIHTSTLAGGAGLEPRPFPLGGYLLVGASICGGRAYAILERFFSRCVEMVTGQSVSCYDAMAALAGRCVPDDPPQFVTTFQGTRSDPAARGSISGLTEANFTPQDLIHSLLHGCAQELYDLYAAYRASGGAVPGALYGSGNGLRKNALLRAVVEQRFGLPLALSPHEEEAACGAALYAASVYERKI